MIKDRPILERDIEKALIKRVKALHGKCEKFTSPQNNAVPDRLCTFHNGVMVFVELKRPNQKPTVLQARDHEQRRVMGFDVRVIDNLEDAQGFLP